MMGMLSIIIVTPFTFFYDAQAVGIRDVGAMEVCASRTAGTLVCVSRLKFTAQLSQSRVPLRSLR